MKEVLTLDYLRDREREEYDTLRELDEMRTHYLKEGNHRLADSVMNSISHQRARWGMIVDLIEEMEGEDE